MHESDSNSASVRLVTVREGEAGQRVDNFLIRRAPGVPRSHIYRIIRTGQVRINSGRCKPTRKLVEGDIVRIPPIKTVTKAQVSVPDELATRIAGRIAYRNDDLIVVDKPAGLAVHGGTGLPFGLIDALRQHEDNPALELVHRIDKGTSGCLLIACNNGVNRKLQNLFRERDVNKRYYAMVSGQWPDAAKTVRLPLLKNQDAGGQRKVIVADGGQSAVSHFERVERFNEATLLEVAIETGRTHQIRVHAQHSGHAIVGDERYGKRFDNERFAGKGLKRLFLHARQLEFEWEGEPISITIEPDAQWQESLTALTKLGK
ncbi:MAG: RluA family pseudouridine synthase [Granulosicoccaceae bacterium]